jgi:hypothetical protein
MKIAAGFMDLHDISKYAINWLYLCNTEGCHTKQTMQQGSNGTPHPSRPIMMCKPFRCIFMYIYYSIIYVISGVREACAYMSLREACEKFARVWRHLIL